MSKTFVFPTAPERRPVLLAGVRTPWCKAGSELARLSSADLGVQAVRELLARAEVEPREVDELVLGCVGPQAKEANVARVVALRAGLPLSTPAFTVNRNCASGFQAIEDAARRIAQGEGSVYVAGGIESMSSYPLLFGERFTGLCERLFRSRSLVERLRALLRFRPGMLKPRVALLEGLTDPFCGLLMGLTAEKLANDFAISRREQDLFALASHEKAVAAQARGDFRGEIADVFLASGALVHRDNGPREGQSLDALAKLRPFFDRREGSVTVGNACPVTDGACAVLLASEAWARARGLSPLARLVSTAVAGLEPSRMGLGPAHAAPLALAAAGRGRDDVAVWEINEAFAAQVLACLRALDSERFCRESLGLDAAFGAPEPMRVNPRGGAIALGHPVGATGARLVLALARQLAGGGLGVATACVGGGQGVAQVWEAAA